ncbi:MAG: hypothetical protein JKY11_09335 [Alphaproteobacteria bacterium]|nr:hypothetical protein [Alphaproteobacteria bacterium]
MSLNAQFSGDILNQALLNDIDKLFESIRRVESNIPSSKENNSTRQTLDEVIFDARANVKVLFSEISMYFPTELKEKLFHQIDLLHDTDDWEDGDNPVQISSFKTFLRWFYLDQPSQLPNFGMSNGGLLIATWLSNHNKDRLILEFRSDDHIKWFATKHYDDEQDMSSGITSASRLIHHLASYKASDWFIKP